MTDRRTEDLDRFESVLREWGRRGSPTPAEFAATRVVAELPRPRPPRRWPRPVWAAAGLLLLLVALWLVPTQQAPQVARNGVAAAPLDDNVVLWWLDDETPVYFVLAPTGESKEGTS